MTVQNSMNKSIVGEALYETARKIVSRFFGASRVIVEWGGSRAPHAVRIVIGNKYERELADESALLSVHAVMFLRPAPTGSVDVFTAGNVKHIVAYTINGSDPTYFNQLERSITDFIELELQ